MFVSALVCEADKHVVHTLQNRHTQWSMHTNTAWSTDVSKSQQENTPKASCDASRSLIRCTSSHGWQLMSETKNVCWRMRRAADSDSVDV